MKMENNWKSKVQNIILALIMSIVIPIVSVIAILGYYYSLDYNYFPTMQDVETLKIAGILLAVSMICIYVWYCISISNFSNIMQDPQDKSNMKKVLYAILINLVGSIITCLTIYHLATSANPKIALLVGMLMSLVVICISMGITIGAYKSLSESPNFTDKCRDGFEWLRSSAVLILITSIISIVGELITFPAAKGVLNIVNLILSIIALVRMFQGWSRVKRNPPIEDEIKLSSDIKEE